MEIWLDKLTKLKKFETFNVNFQNAKLKVYKNKIENQNFFMRKCQIQNLKSSF